MTVTLTPGQVDLATLEQVYWQGTPAQLASSARAGIEKAAARIAAVAAGNDAVYGVNTGFGKLASIKIAQGDVATLQRNLILSHCCGVGDPLPENIVRLIMTLKLVSLGRGASGVRPVVVELIEAMLAKGVMPVIPEKGSVGASGDLAPLAHMTAAMLGESEAVYNGERLASADALRKAGLCSRCAWQRRKAWPSSTARKFPPRLRWQGCFVPCGPSRLPSSPVLFQPMRPWGPPRPLPRRYTACVATRGRSMWRQHFARLLDGSEIRASHRDDDERVQDPYCLRCQPQVNGACLDVLRQAANTLRIEANAATDNPLVLSNGEVVSGGNFHAEPVALAADQIALAVAEIGAIAQRRVAMLVDPALSFGLPGFLTPKPGLNSGMMIAEVTTAALMSENKQLAHPASIDSTPTSANQEDHVSMACHGARRLLPMTQNLFWILGVEAMVGAQGVSSFVARSRPRLPLLLSAPSYDRTSPS